MGGSSGYRETLRQPVAARLWVAVGTSVVGDYVGLGAVRVPSVSVRSAIIAEAVPEDRRGGPEAGKLDRLTG